MAKSKLVKANEKLADVVVDGYKKIENVVTGGFKKVSDAVVNGYTKIEDKFVGNYLAHDGESVEEAKARLVKEEKIRKEEQQKEIEKVHNMHSKTTEEIQAEIYEKYGK